MDEPPSVPTMSRQEHRIDPPIHKEVEGAWGDHDVTHQDQLAQIMDRDIRNGLALLGDPEQPPLALEGGSRTRDIYRSHTDLMQVPCPGDLGRAKLQDSASGSGDRHAIALAGRPPRLT